MDVEFVLGSCAIWDTAPPKGYYNIFILIYRGEAVDTKVCEVYH